MRFLHLSDLHLGKNVNEISMIDDQKYILEEIVQMAIDKKADAVLIAGDVYDRSVPSEEAVSLLDSFLNALIQAKIQVYMISGNHDSDERLQYGSELFRSNGLFIKGIYDGNAGCETFADEYGEIKIWMLPYVKSSIAAHYHPELKCDTYDAAVRSAVSLCDVKPEERNIILAHQFVTASGKDPEQSGSETFDALQVGTIEKVNADVFDSFDYAALGHIHRPQKVGRETVRYAGSILKYSRSEINQTKSVPIVTMKEKGKIEIEYAELKPMHDMRSIKGKIQDILNPANILYPQDYMFVTLSDEQIAVDAIDRIRHFYPNVMHLEYENSHTAALCRYDISSPEKKISFEDLINDFSRKVNGHALNEEQIEILKDIAAKEGMEDETH